MLTRIAKRGDPVQTEKQSDLGLHCLSRPFWQVADILNFKIFIIISLVVIAHCPDMPSVYFFCLNNLEKWIIHN